MTNKIELPEAKVKKENVLVYHQSGSARIYTSMKKALEDHYNIKAVNLKEENSLIEFLNDSEKDIAFVAVDAGVLKLLQGTNVYDYFRMLSTILLINHNEPNIFVVLHHDTNVDQIKELMNIPEVKGVLNPLYRTTNEEFCEAVDDMRSGKFHVPKKIKDLLNQQKKKPHKVDEIELTPRQQQILNLVVSKGASNKVIAKILKISESTVKLHITNILKKYGLRNRTQLALFAKPKD